MPEPRQLDVITIGRSSVDLYGQQIGSRLEDIDTFAKSVGGCPSNIAIGTSRLGLNSGVITRVGDEQMGRFITEQMVRENVSTQGISSDPSRLTALVILSVRDEETFPLIFYRDNCADMALEEADIDPDFIRSAASIVVTGTHFSTSNVELASRKAIKIARDAGLKVIFDIDYRPNLWGLAGHDAGEERYIASKNVSDKLKTILSDCDLVVGTEEELMIAGGQDEPLAAIREIRSLSDATIVCKRGPMGCVVFPDVIPDDLDKGIKGPGFPVDVYNVLGAGDAFMSGFLRGYLRNEPLETCAQWANACGAFAVSRLLCSPESPTWAELQYFLEHGSQHRALRKDQDINHIHHATTRRPQTETLMALAIDHRKQLEEIADRHNVSYPHLEHFKKLAVQAAVRVAQGKPGYGMLLDSDYGRTALYEAEGQPFWIGRPVEKPGSRPLDFDHGGSLAARLTEWPVDHCVKCLCFYHPDDASDLRDQQERELLRLNDASRTVGREMLVEIIAGKNGSLDAETIPRVMRRLYDLGIKPDWWKLEPQTDAAAWQNVDRLIDERDPYCRGVVILGLNAPEQELLDSFKTAQTAKHVKGFAVGRTIFADAAEQWLKGDFNDDQAVTDMAERFARLTQAWIGMKS